MRYCFAVLLVLAGCAATPQKQPHVERISPQELEQLLPRPQPNLTLDEIVRMSREGAMPEAIIDKVKETGSGYDLIPSQMLELSRQGVDARVLNFIYASREQALRDGFAEELGKRELACRIAKDELKQELLNRPYWGCDPFWYPYPYFYWYPPYYRFR